MLDHPNSAYALTDLVAFCMDFVIYTAQFHS